MKSNTVLIRAAQLTLPMAMISALLFVVGSVLAENTATPASGAQSETKELKQEWSEAFDALKDYSAAQRDEAIDRAKEVIAAMDKRIDRIERLAENQWSQLSAEMRQGRSDALRELRRQRNELAVWYGGMRQSSVVAWEEVKQGFINAYQDLGDAFNKAQAEFDSPDAKPSGAQNQSK